MEIILSPTCTSLTGTLNKKHGYYIRESKGRFFGQRKAKGVVPPDGHLRFILDCAELAQCHLFVADILVTPEELDDALEEAGLDPSLGARHDSAEVLHASDILSLKHQIRL